MPYPSPQTFPAPTVLPGTDVLDTGFTPFVRTPYWRFVLCDLTTGVALGELRNTTDRKVSHAFNGRAFTASGNVRVDDPLADRIMACDVILKVYEDANIRFCGILDSAEEVWGSTVSSIATVWSDPWWYMSRRFIGKTLPGVSDGSVLAQKDKSQLVADLLGAANTEGYTGIDVTTVLASGSNGYLEPMMYKSAADAITEVINTLGAPDVVLTPQEPQSVGQPIPRMATMQILPAVGQAQPAAVFEWGFGRRNVANGRRTMTRSTQANAVYVLPGSSSTDQGAGNARDTVSIAQYGLMETVVQADLAPELRQQLSGEHLAIRKNPRTVIVFQPTREDPAYPGRVPQYGTDFGLGDTVTFRAVEPETGSVRVNAAMRVYGVEWDIDNQGVAVPSFTLTAS